MRHERLKWRRLSQCERESERFWDDLIDSMGGLIDMLGDDSNGDI